MKRGALIAVSVVGLLLLGGCVGPLADDAPDESTNSDADPANGTTTPATATEAPSPTQTPTATPTETSTATPTETATATPQESWSEPQQPNRPLQDNRDEEQGERIQNVAVTGSGGGSDGSASFRIDVTANTSMPSVDPAEHGTVRGEPFFLVYMDAETNETDRFTRLEEGDLVERSPELSHESEGEYTLTVPQEAFEHYDAEPGEHELLILLMDQDKDWDDIYGLQRITVEYQPDES